jgi:Amt family ammonium transporter
VFVSFYAFFKLVDATLGNRVPASVELEGLDIPEMGALAYPDFVLGPGASIGSPVATTPAPASAASLKPVRTDV